MTVKLQKATPQKAWLKMGFYGMSGSGKTVLSLMVAEGLASLAKGRIALLDTEHGTDFYAGPVGARSWHPEPFDFDVLHSRSLSDALELVRGLDVETHKVLVVDSVTHLWEAAKEAYRGHVTKIGTIPFQAWGQIKKPYKDLISLLLNLDAHVIITGRQGVEYATDDETDELKAVGYKMKAEGETPYEPDILVRLEAEKIRGKTQARYLAYFEKDRSGLLGGKVVHMPSWATFRPLVDLLSGQHGKIEADTSEKDSELLDAEEERRAEKARAAADRYDGWHAQIVDAASVKELSAIWAAVQKRGSGWTQLTAEAKQALIGVKDRAKGKLIAQEEGL